MGAEEVEQGGGGPEVHKGPMEQGQPVRPSRQQQTLKGLQKKRKLY